MKLMTMKDRFHAAGNADAAAFAPSLRLERGTPGDYRALAPFHYRSGRPGAVTAVYRLVHEEPTIVARFRSRRSPRVDSRRIVGVLVRALPPLGCAARDHATRGRYAGLTRRERAVALNREMRTIARVVIHPQWRGLGLAVMLVRFALRDPEPGVIYTEALAAMGRVHPFFEKAGMTRYDRPLRREHARLLDAMSRLDLAPALLASPRTLQARLLERSELDQAWFEHELSRWYRAGARRSRSRSARQHERARDEPDLAAMLRAARDHVLAQPVYYLFRHDEPA